MSTFLSSYDTAAGSFMPDLNYPLLRMITGANVSPEDYNLQEDVFSNLSYSATKVDVERYDNLQDLFWWYCKMDVYQSILGGTKLL